MLLNRPGAGNKVSAQALGSQQLLLLNLVSRWTPRHSDEEAVRVQRFRHNSADRSVGPASEGGGAVLVPAGWVNRISQKTASNIYSCAGGRNFDRKYRLKFRLIAWGIPIADGRHNGRGLLCRV